MTEEVEEDLLLLEPEDILEEEKYLKEHELDSL